MQGNPRTGSLFSRCLASGVLSGAPVGLVLGLVARDLLAGGPAAPATSSVHAASVGALGGVWLGGFTGLAVWVALEAAQGASLARERVVAGLAAALATAVGVTLVAGPEAAVDVAPLTAALATLAGVGAAAATRWMVTRRRTVRARH